MKFYDHIQKTWHARYEGAMNYMDAFKVETIVLKKKAREFI